MRISIFGLGYVGAVSAGCLARDGHDVTGVDPVQAKVELINAGQTPVIEREIGDIIGQAVKDGRLRATTDASEAIRASDLSLICVGTPSQSNGNLDLSFVQQVCEQVGVELGRKDGFHVVVVRSTMLPGSMRGTVIPALESASGKRAGRDFGVCNNPEFLREGTSVHDFYHPPKTVIGETEQRSGDLLATLYGKLDAPLIRTSLETAEMVKYTDNVWHALKVSFANEVGNICKSLGIDSHEVMDIFCRDTKLNLSPYYLKPGFAFGGSCLPKDVRALMYRAKTLDVEAPVLNAIMPSNANQIDVGFRRIVAKPGKRVGFLGFSFKAGTDDLRESPLVELIERLVGKGYDVRIYDRNVNVARLVGANRSYILDHIPHISNLMVETVQDVLDHSDTVVIGNAAEEFRAIHQRLRDGQSMVDLVRIAPGHVDDERYDGLSW
ncbi:MAG: nucleotide sugar dehydrogenase [Geminicoccales bacterium]